jgi:hypothetical protein
MAAEDRVSNRRKAAVSALRELARLGRETGFIEHRSYYQAHGRLAIARANQETLIAQRRLAEKHIRVAKLRLEASYEAAESVESQLTQAQLSVGAILTEMGKFGWMTTSSYHGPQEPWSSDSESDHEGGNGMDYGMDPDNDEVEGYGD